MEMACVSILLREAAPGPGTSPLDIEVGFIQRVQRSSDPWSGQIAFPGGKAEKADSNDFATALREVQEEIGFDLRTELFLGKVSDQQARSSLRVIPLFLRPFVFFVAQKQAAVLQADEVKDFFWVRLSELSDPRRHVLHSIPFLNKKLELPAVDVGRDVPLWGLTYKIMSELITHLLKMEESDLTVFKSLGLNSEGLKSWRPGP